MGIRDAVEAATGGDTVEFGAVSADTETPAPFGPAAAPGSVVSELRARAQALAAEQSVDLEVPGYSGVLVARYAAVSISRVYVQNPENPILPKWEVGADALARALVGLYGRNEHGDPEPLQHDVPTRFDDELVQMLGLEPAERTARAVLVALCGGGEMGESRVWAHFMAYQGWLLAGVEGDASPVQEVIDMAVGEYPAR